MPVAPITMFSATTLPSKWPWISTVSASIDPVIEPVSLTINSFEKTGPLTKPATSIAPELLIVPSMLTVSLINERSESLIFLLSPNLIF